MALYSSTVSRSNLNLGMLVFVEGGKQEYPEKNLGSRGKNQQQTQPTGFIPVLTPYSNLSNFGGRRVLSTLCHPYSPRACCTCAFVPSNILYVRKCSHSCASRLIIYIHRSEPVINNSMSAHTCTCFLINVVSWYVCRKLWGPW